MDNLRDYRGDLVAVVWGRNDGSRAAERKVTTGWYPSNYVTILLQNYAHYVGVVVDSSGSNSWTHASNLPIVAAKRTVRGLTSFSEAISQNKLPDLASAIGFDLSVKVPSGFEDPDVFKPTSDSVDSSGGTPHRRRDK